MHWRDPAHAHAAAERSGHTEQNLESDAVDS